MGSLWLSFPASIAVGVCLFLVNNWMIELSEHLAGRRSSADPFRQFQLARPQKSG